MRVLVSIAIVGALAACSPAKEEAAPTPEPVAEKPADAGLVAGIRIDAPRAGARIESPYTAEGLVEPGWFLEGTFDIAVVDAEGLAIGRSPAKPTVAMEGDKPVPFAATITFKQPAEDKQGMVVFTEENSDPKDEARQLRIPVTLAAKAAK